MESKRSFVVSLVAIGIVLVMLSGVAAADNLSVSLSGSGDKTYSRSNFSNYREGDYLILSGSLSGTVTINGNLNVVFNGVEITQNNHSSNGAFVIGNGYTVTVYLTDGTVNTITGLDGRASGYANNIQGAGKAGIFVPSGSALIIDSVALNGDSFSLTDVEGNGELTASGGKGGKSSLGNRLAGSGSGIGGRGGYDDSNSRDGTDVGSIIIKNGVITAVGGDSAGNAVGPGRDIGGGSGAYRNSNGAGGYGGSVELIEIKGGTVNTVTYGIGGGHGGDKYGSAGGGNGGSAVIDISGGTIYVDSGYGTLIGGGNGGDSQSGYFNESQGTGGTGSIDIGGDAFVFIPADVDTSNLTGEISAGCNGNDGNIQGTVTGTVGGTINLGNLFSADSAIFYANGGSFGLGSIYSIKVSDGMTLSDLSFETFVGPSDNADQLGWFKEENTTEGVNGIRIAEGDPLSPGTFIQKTQKYYMIWTADLTLNPNGGTFYDGASPAESRTATVQIGMDWEDVNGEIIFQTGSDDPSYDPWDFGGWWSAGSGIINESADTYWGDSSNKRDLEDDPILGSETFYAYWSGNITLDANGGTFADSTNTDKTVTIQPGMNLTQLNSAVTSVSGVLSNSPWEFDGWYKTEASGVVSDKWIADGLNPDSSLYAGWFGDVTLDANGGAFGISGEETASVKIQEAHDFHDIGSLIDALSLSDPVNGDWTPSKWYTSAANNVVDLESEWEEGGLDAGDSLYVAWTTDIELNANDGTFGDAGPGTTMMTIQQANTFDDIEILINALGLSDPVNGDWTPSKWYISAAGNIVDFESRWVEGGLDTGDSLYVAWTTDITLDANGGAFGDLGPETSTVTIQKANTFDDIEILITALGLSDPVNGDWTPSKWYTSAENNVVDLESEWTDDSEGLTVGDSLFVAWTTDIELNANGGTFGDLGPETATVTIQKANTFDDIQILITALGLAEPVNGDWTSSKWYTFASNNIVNLESKWEDGGLETGDVLYTAWLGSLTLRTNGGSVGDQEEAEIQSQETLEMILERVFGADLTHTNDWEFAGWFDEDDTADSEISDIKTVMLYDEDDIGKAIPNDAVFDAEGTIYAGWTGPAVFIAEPGVFHVNEEFGIEAETVIYEMENVQPGENLQNRIPAAVYSGYRVNGWLLDGETWPSYFEMPSQTVTADWVQIPSGGGSGTGGARVVDGDSSSSGELIDSRTDGGEPVIDTPVGFEEELTSEQRNNMGLYLIIAAILILVIAVGGIYYFKNMKKK